MSKGFGKVSVEIPLRSFYCELKHRPEDDQTGEREELIEVLNLQLPKLGDSILEKQWMFTLLWDELYKPEYTNKGINQVFVFTAEAQELIARMEINQFEDEQAYKIAPPEPEAFKRWQQTLEKRFKSLYGISLKEWGSSYQAKSFSPQN